jgi:hypothetical protein
VIWVAGVQKITPTLEDQRQRSLGNQAGSHINRILIIESEHAYLRRNLILILVNEPLGF